MIDNGNYAEYSMYIYAHSHRSIYQCDKCRYSHNNILDYII